MISIIYAGRLPQYHIIILFIRQVRGNGLLFHSLFWDFPECSRGFSVRGRTDVRQPWLVGYPTSSKQLETVICVYKTLWCYYRIYAVVTFEIKLFQNYFSLRRRPTKIILFQRVEICLELFQNYFRSLLQLMNFFQHVQCRWNNFEIISATEIIVFKF